MLLIKHDSGTYYTPGVDYRVEYKDGESVVTAYDRDGRMIKEHTFKSEVEVSIV